MDTPRKIGWMALPVVAFATLALLFGVSLRSGDPSKLPSTFLDKPSPAYAFTAVDGLDTLAPSVNGFDQTTLASGMVTVVNFWASWCAPCVEEHPQLVALQGRPGVTIAGVNVKDDPAAARRFLARYGNPFAMIGADRNGRGSIEWGVYGTPETFIVNGRGIIVYKHVGPITADALAKKIIPMIDAARR